MTGPQPKKKTTKPARPARTPTTPTIDPALNVILTACENRLGWIPEIGHNTGRAAYFKARVAMARRLSGAMAKTGDSTQDLQLALAYCLKKRQPITSPLDLLAYIERARERAAIPDLATGDLDQAKAAAIAWEQSIADPESPRWITRLTRAISAGLVETLSEWRAAGRGQRNSQKENP